MSDRLKHDAEVFARGCVDAERFGVGLASGYALARESAKSEGRLAPAWDYWLGFAWICRLAEASDVDGGMLS